VLENKAVEPADVNKYKMENNPSSKSDLIASDADFLTNLEKKSGIPKLYLAIGGVVLAWIAIVSMFGAQAFIHFVAFAYPAYMSFKTLERTPPAAAAAAASPSPSPSPNPHPNPTPTPGSNLGVQNASPPVNANANVSPSPVAGPADAPQLGEGYNELVNWLTYWVVYALFMVFEMVADPLLDWMLWYNIAKLIFLFWCFLPQTMGCGVVYRVAIRPFLNANEKRIDTILDRLQFAAVQAGAEIRDVASELFVTAISNFGSSVFVSRLAGAQPNNAAAGKKDGKDAAPPQTPQSPQSPGAGDETPRAKDE